MKKYIVYALVLIGFGLFVNAQKDFQNEAPIAFKNTTFANSQVDTVHFYVKRGIATLSFGVRFYDSVSVTSGVIKRIVNGEPTTALAGDTLPLTSFSNTTAGFMGTTANPSSARLITVNLSPVPDEFWFIITYASSGNGVTNNTVRYEVGNMVY